MIRREITENNEQQNMSKHEETSATKWKNTRKVVTVVASEVVG